MDKKYLSWTRDALIERIRELEALVFIDELTGLPNRRAFEKALLREMSRVQRRMGEPLALALVDLDSFKSVNDTYGHFIGDRLLVKLGELLRQGLRSIDFVGRVGGEEFVILMPATSLSDAMLHIERVRKHLETSLFVSVTIEQEKIRVARTASFGVTVWRSGKESNDDFLKRADEALYEAKSEGRNRAIARR